MRIKFSLGLLVMALILESFNYFFPKWFNITGVSKAFLMLSGDILIVLISAIVISGVLTKSLRSLAAASTEISRGDFTKPIIIESKDEIGELAGAFNTMRENVLHVIREVKATSFDIFESAQNLSATSQEMNASIEEIASNVVSVSRGAEKQAEMVTKSSKLIRDMAESIQRVAEKADSASSLAADAAGKARTGGAAAETAINEITRIGETVGKTSLSVEGFRSRALDINNAVDMITTISQQTHLLALNATIEAARAGEHGRGFAVVAEEIRKLAENAKNFAGQISMLAHEINSESETVLKSMNETNDAAASGIESVVATGEKLKEIVASVMTTVGTVEEISSLTAEQSTGSENMVVAIDEISKIAEENASSTEEASAAGEEITASMDEMAQSAQSLAKMSDRLKEAVSIFNVNENPYEKEKNRT